MCGIAGVLLVSGTTESRRQISLLAHRSAERMRDAPHIRRRGPDSSHILTLPDDRGFFVGSRLAITDSSSREADIPMRCASTGMVLTFNGELYNFRNLRSQLHKYPFQTEGDTEVIFAAHQEWGLRMFEHLEGMYAFALFDPRVNAYLLAVDHAGQKPLVYSRIVVEGHEALVFASDQETLLRSGLVTPDLDRKKLAVHFGMRYLPGDSTVFTDIKKLENGTALIGGEHVDSQIVRHFRLTIDDQATRSEESLRNGLLEALIAAEAAVVGGSEWEPLLLLSGGVDSTALTALACRRLGAQHPVSVLTLGADAGLAMNDERQAAQEFISTLPTLPRQLATIATCDTLAMACTEWREHAPELVFSRDLFGLMLMLQRAKEYGFRVVVTGCGPDEFFEGYTFTPRLEKLTSDKDEIPHRYFDASCFIYDVNLDSLFGHSLPELRLFVQEVCSSVLTCYPELAKSSYLQAVQVLNWHTRSQFECSKTDLVGGHYSLECRKPYYERSFVDASFRVPGALKLRDGIRKYLFRKSLENTVLPHHVAFREKVVFSTPPVVELRQLRDHALLLNGALYDSGALSIDYAREINGAGKLTAPLAEQIIFYNKVLDRLCSVAQDASRAA